MNLSFKFTLQTTCACVFALQFASATAGVRPTTEFTSCRQTVSGGTKNNSKTDTIAIEKHRIWLTLQTQNGPSTTILVGYVTGATLGIDIGYDAVNFGNVGGQFYSIIEGGEYIIQGRPLPFVTDDIVPLGFKAVAAGNFSISVLNQDGLFAGNQDIFIRDNLTNTTTSIKTAPYSFYSDSGIFNQRFEIVYVNPNLATDDNIGTGTAKVYSDHGMLFVQSNKKIEAMRIFDIQGRLLSETANINSTHFQMDQLRREDELLIIKITDYEGGVVVKKMLL